MREAIDYYALSWIRQEVGVTLKQARQELEEYAEGEQRKELLQGCAAHLHEARGPLQMVNIKGADLLTCEMEEAIADLLLETVAEKEILLEQLMQGFLELPEYLSNLRSGKQDKPRLLFPLINSLRASRGLQPLKEEAVFSPDLTARMPVSEFDEHADHEAINVTTLARSARVRFQSGLLEWYRDSSTNQGLHILVEVLEHLQKSACSEPAARLWWAGAGVAELLRDGVINVNSVVKRLFGQLDRQIKRLMDDGEKVFADVLSEDLVRNLLFQMVGVNTESARIKAIRSTYGIASQNEVAVGDNAEIQGIGDELLQTVSTTARDDIDRIKEQLDTLARTSNAGPDVLSPVADGLHSLSNTLGMIGMEGLGARLAEDEQQVRRIAATDGGIEGTDFTDLANTLVAVEDALSDIITYAGNNDNGEDHGEAVLRQGQQAVVNAVIADIAAAKDAFNEFLKSSDGFDSLNPVPDFLNKICGGLDLVGEERLALVTRQVRNFVSIELLGSHRELTEDELDKLADAICSIEYCVEELSENHKYGERAIGVAVESLDKLGYSHADLLTETSVAATEQGHISAETPETASEAVVLPIAEEQPEQIVAEKESIEPPAVQATTAGMPGIADLQVIAPDADSEIVDIFLEEAGEVLEKLAVDIPAWIMHTDDREILADIRRAFHTIKGSGRMVGAMAASELAWAFENLINKVIECSVPANATLLELVGKSTQALKDLVAQVSNPDTILLTDISALGRHAAQLCRPEAYIDEHSPEALASEVPAMSAIQEQEAFAAGTQDEPAAVIAEPNHPVISEPEYEIAASEYAQIFTVETNTSQAIDDIAAGHEEVPDVMASVAAESDELFETGVQSGAVESVDTVADALPVLKRDADPEIVEIFLEEASDELASISLKIPEWLQQQDNNELLGDICRNLHTLKGSGRMAGAMLIGEFAWSMEVLLNKLSEGVVQPGGALFALLAQVPQAVSCLLRQLQDGIVPDMDISGMMQKAADLENAGPDAPVGQHPAAEQEEAARVADETAMHAVGDDDSILLELYSTECREHLDILSLSVANLGHSCMVSEGHYRALHTLSGISESAGVPGIGQLAAALYDYFEELYQENRPVVPAAFSVLDECVHEMSAQLQRLPDRNFDNDVVAALLGRIAALPSAAVLPGEVPVQLHDQNTLSTAPHSDKSLTDLAASFDEIPELPVAVLSPDDEQASLSAGDEEESSGLEAVDHAPVDTAITEEAVEEPGTETTDPSPPQDNGVMYSGMDQELFEIFVEEATEIIDSSEGALRSWTEAPDEREMMADFQRLLHTLKGGARMVDINAIGDLSHAVESLMTQVADGVVPANDDLFTLLQDSHDRLAEMVEMVKSRAPIDAATDLESRLIAFARGETDATATASYAEDMAVEDQPEIHYSQQTRTDTTDRFEGNYGQFEDDSDEAPDADLKAHPEIAIQDCDTGLMAQAMAMQPQMVERRKEARSRGELVRVQSDVLDNLVNNAGEINIYRSRMEQQVSNFRFNLTELDQTINRLRDQLRQLEMETEAQILFRYEQEVESRNQDFDPLEMDRYSKLQQLSRSLIESISDLRSLQGLMEMTARDSETLLLQQSRVSTDLQEGLIRTRMIPFAGLAPRLRRIVRQSARQLDKKVDLHLRGAEGEMDRAVIERIVAPLEHMLRNAVAHGIETPDRRKKAGKRAAGTITIEFNREGTEIVLRIVDDGAGLDIDAIRARAIERGLLASGLDLPDSDVMQFVLQTGFSTASEVTQISGRGVGMDVVNSEVKQLGGSLHIDSEPGNGSVFTIRLPYTLAINQALLITVGEQIFCVPMGSIEGAVTATVAQLQSCYEDDGHEFGYAGHNYQLMHLGSLLGISRMDQENLATQVPVLLVRVGDKRIGMQVDSLLGNREVVIKPLGAQLSMVDGISGATILGDGRVVMILDMFAVSRMKVREHAPVWPAGSMEDSRLVVMVVDDSITVRKVTSRLLERSGYKVMTAKDGVDAMGLLQEIVPDMMLLDIEMPRMDGFELATHMRNDERLKHVPIIMITSRTGDKHRERAFEIGVNDYLGKPYQESELLTSINNIIGVNTLAARA